MSFAQAVLIVAILAVIVVFILIYTGQYKPPKYPQFGR
jgi:hypothetical protein